MQGPAGRKCRVETRKRVLGKSQRLLCSEAPIEDFYALIEQEKAVFPITWMCRNLDVSRASYYRWPKPMGLTPTVTRHLKLKDAVAQEFKDSSHMAGRDQLARLLHQRGVKVSSGTVGAMMNELGVPARRMRAWKTTTVNDPAARTEHIKNHMLDSHGKRDFSANVPGTRLVGDITYLKDRLGVALSGYRDRCSYAHGGGVVNGFHAPVTFLRQLDGRIMENSCLVIVSEHV